MAFDGFVTRAIALECDRLLRNGRISKIHQPSDSDIILQIRANGENYKLLLSANPSYPRVHLSKESFGNPLEPPMFCMLLRKHCEGALIDSITQIGLERIISIALRVRDELGDWKRRTLMIEIMGRHSNILLVDPDRELILDGIHHVTPGMSRHRVVLPGRTYIAPPDQGKLNPLETGKESFIAGLDFNAGKLDKQLVDRFSGLSPLVAKEIVHRADLLSRDELWETFANIMKEFRNGIFRPQIKQGKAKTYFSILDLTHIPGETETFSSISTCVETFFSGKAERDAVKQRAYDLIRFAGNELEKNKNKIIKLEETLVESEQAEQYRLNGELIMANVHALKKGEEEARVINYYVETTPYVSIPLDPALTPIENAQAYYRKYNKAKSSQQFVKEQIDLAKKEIEYFERIIQQLENASVHDIQEIREELIEEGYFRVRAGKKDPRRRKNDKPQIEKYTSSEGVEILVGKNNKQNEYLTNRVASSTDTWLHTKDIPGSHVVIRAKEFGDNTLLEAAQLAAFFSKAKGSSQVPVDYTLVKYVKKPNGAKPGFVIYEQQRTIFVSNQEEAVKHIRSHV